MLSGMQEMYGAVCLGALSLGLVLSIVRFYKGPDLPHRLMAVEVISLITLSMILVGCIGFDKAQFIDVVLIGSLVPFLGSMIILRIFQKEAPSSHENSKEEGS
jgi:multicomponent Na+:H+ antiporter subunit F